MSTPETLADWLAHCAAMHPKTMDLSLERTVEVARKQTLQNAPKVIEVPVASQDAGVVNGSGRSEPASKGGAEKSGP